METTKDKIRSIGCLLAGIGMLLTGVASIVLVVALCTVDVGRLTGLTGSGIGSGDAAGASGTNVVSVILSLATNVSAAAQRGGDPLDGFTDGTLEGMQRQLLEQLSDPARMAGQLDGALLDTNTQKQIMDILNSDLFRSQLEQLLGGQLVPVAGSGTNK